MKTFSFIILLAFLCITSHAQQTWIRINQLGYTPGGIKVAVLASKEKISAPAFEVIDSSSGKVLFKNTIGKNYGSYGPFVTTYRLNFSSFKKNGVYRLKSGKVFSPYFKIDDDIYKGSADFLLNYMRQQQCGFNSYTRDSCHTHDAYTMYGPMRDSTHIDVTGGWHDASDYLQYSTTSANATYHLLAAYRDFPTVFRDGYLSNGLEGRNNMPDVLDVAKWGLDWLLKMHPKSDWMFNQIADDRDHKGMRMPKEDNYYGKGFERPVYFCSGTKQGLGKYKNNQTGVASTAGKFSSAFAMGYKVFYEIDPQYATGLKDKSFTAYEMGLKQPGNCQTASVLSPYIYAEDNWTDDMELAAAELFSVTKNKKYINDALSYAAEQPVTPWLGKDTAKHYQWYPFINIGHYANAAYDETSREKMIAYYQKGIDLVYNKANKNAFFRGVPFIWCSNNLTTSFAIQCLWYRQISKSEKYDELMQANIDWLFGCNPWGTSMVYGLPSWGDSPVDPHAAFSKIGNMPVDGGLVDGPVYGNIYKNLIGIKLMDPDEYADFQSDLVVYHDDYGDYSTNEPTMDGTASLVYLMAALEAGRKFNKNDYYKGAIVRGDSTKKRIALVFTGDEFGDGGDYIHDLLKKEGIRASFFFTGNFYRNASFKNIIQGLKASGNYLGAHSDKHLLYADWKKRDSLLIGHETFKNDLERNYEAMRPFGIFKKDARYFLPPYEWYNETVAGWTKDFGLQLVNFTPGTRSTADYTIPEAAGYRSSEEIYNSIVEREKNNSLNGFLLLSHIGTAPGRTDKFYRHLPRLISYLKHKGYQFVTVPQMVQ